MPNIDCGWSYVIDWFVYYVYAWSQLIHRYVCALVALTDLSICICIDHIHWSSVCICIDRIDRFVYYVYALIALTDSDIIYMHWSHWLIRILCWCIDHIDRFVYYVYALIALTNSDIMYMHGSHWPICILCVFIGCID